MHLYRDTISTANRASQPLNSAHFFYALHGSLATGNNAAKASSEDKQNLPYS